MTTNKRKNTGATILVAKDGLLLDHSLSVVTDGCKYYFNSRHKFFDLNTKQRAYFDFLCEKMDLNNKVHLNPAIRKEFISFCENITGDKAYCVPKTLEGAEKVFIKLHLVIKVKGSMLSVVNPKYVYKGTQSQREELYVELANLASAGKIPYEAILDKPISAINPDEKFKAVLDKHFSELPEGFVAEEESEPRIPTPADLKALAKQNKKLKTRKG